MHKCASSLGGVQVTGFLFSTGMGGGEGMVQLEHPEAHLKESHVFAAWRGTNEAIHQREGSGGRGMANHGHRVLCFPGPELFKAE